MRFYEFRADEIAGSDGGGMLDLDIDPKLAWALRHRGLFPVDVNRAGREVLLRVPGFGTKTVDRLVKLRRHKALRWDDLGKVGALTKKAAPFVETRDWHPRGLTDSAGLRERFAPPPEQLALI